jgi:hypothetical protein
LDQDFAWRGYREVRRELVKYVSENASQHILETMSKPTKGDWVDEADLEGR